MGRTYDAADWARAIRHGVGPDGEPLLGMPSVSFHRLSDADTEALVAYLQQIEPVDRRLPPTTVRPLGALLIGVGQIDPAKNVVAGTDHPEHVPVAATVKHGAYLYGAACQHCYGADPGPLGRRRLPGGPLDAVVGVRVSEFHRDDRAVPLRPDPRVGRPRIHSVTNEHSGVDLETDSNRFTSPLNEP